MLSIRIYPIILCITLPWTGAFGANEPPAGFVRPGAIDRPQALTDADFFGDPRRVELGRLLFFDKILSGNRNISCATCHHSLTGTTDLLSLPVGEGGRGLGPARDTGAGLDRIVERVPRNSPAVFNLGARGINVLFHDGRVATDPLSPSGFASPAGDALPPGFEHVLEVQAMFPVTSATEMAGQPGENPVADAAHEGNLAAVWHLLAVRLQAIPEYGRLFAQAFDDVQAPTDIRFEHAAKAIAAFEAVAWRFDQSPFDQWLRGDPRALSPAARRGAALFYGSAGCSRCHAGALQTDQKFYAIGMPQVGPGKGDNADGFSDGADDFGRERVTGNREDRYRFRTPTLRNVAMTGPWGHAGAFNTLEGVVRHHLDPQRSLAAWTPAEAVLPYADHLPTDDAVFRSPARTAAIAAANELLPDRMSERNFADLMAFLHALTDPRALTELRLDIPLAVPSGLPVAD